MGPPINDPFRNLTPERCRELARREPALRAAARRWLFTALVSSLRRAVEWRIASRPKPKSAVAARRGSRSGRVTAE
jgi:hypothetical protein